MSVREQVVLMGVEAGTAILGASGGPQHVNPPPVLPRTKIGKLDCLFLVPIMASISLVILLVQAFGPRIYRFINKRLAARRGYDTVIPEEDETETAPAPKTYMPSEGLGKDLMKHIKLVGIVAWVFDLLRLLVIMTLFALSIYATVVAHAPVAHGHPGKQGAHGLGEDGEMTTLRGKGRHGNGNGNGKKHRKNRKANFDFVTQEWAEFGLTVFFAYTVILCALLLGLKVTSPLRKPIALHSYALLFLTWCIFAYRDLYPLLTKTLTPVDILHAPAWLTWTRIALLTIAAAVLPSLQPQRYLNLTWASLDLGKFGIGSNKAQSFLKDYVPSSESRVEPHITLTFAQSLDDKIAGAGGKQLALSGKESMLMTHWMRSMHEGIMVGVGTAINDDPRLNVRLLSQSYHSQTPQPIVLDPKLRLPPTARMLQALKDKDSPHAKTPWLLCQKIQDWDQDIKQRKALLEEAGAKIVEVDMVEGRMDLATLPSVLKQLEIRTLMIEGGSSIIDQVLKATRTNPDGLKRPLADSIIVTIAPVNVGADGTGYSIGSGFEAISSAYQRKSSQKFGKDNVLAFTNSFALSA